MDIDARLHQAALRLAEACSGRLPVHELRPAVRAEIARLCACILEVDDDAVAVRGQLVFESLQAVTLQTVVQACLGLSLPLDQLLEGIDPEQVTELLLHERANAAGGAGNGAEPGLRVEPDPAGRFEPFPLTDVQQAYLLGRDGPFELGNVTSTFYAELDTVDLDVDRLEAAFNGLVDRHDALRTVVSPDGYQRVLPEVGDYRFGREDLSAYDAAARDARLANLRAGLGDSSFDPSCWPLFEVRATRLDERRVRLHLVVDLLIADGASIARLLWELSERYADPGRVWPKVEVSFRDYQLAVEGLVGSGRFERARRYWLDRLDGLAAAPELPLAGA
ncbi:MAG TPA: condensation domain-containing protein, partial [Pseudonocardiaceae bacterium]|nr:condensation domain-containing protein [Pseudonocardiaceae bacterium]